MAKRITTADAKRRSRRQDGGFRALVEPRVELLFLFQLLRDVVKLSIERATDRVDGGDDYHRNSGGDQTIFNRGSARLILEERENLTHLTNSYGHPAPYRWPD
jgi:hypothetical protein